MGIWEGSLVLVLCHYNQYIHNKNRPSAKQNLCATKMPQEGMTQCLPVSCLSDY